MAEAQGGTKFRDSHPGCEIEIRLSRGECDYSRWEVRYNSPTGSENFNVYPNNQEIINTTLKQIENVKAATEVYASDAQLVFVTSPNISLTGSAEWQYVFKSDSQQKVYQFISKPNGLICLSEEISGFLSKEDYLECIPIPDSWIDIDSR